jgi:hypothetical protein
VQPKSAILALQPLLLLTASLPSSLPPVLRPLLEAEPSSLLTPLQLGGHLFEYRN